MHYRSYNLILRDPRWFQIASLGSFLMYGGFQLHWFEAPERILVILTFTLLTQAFFVVSLGLPKDALKSGAITGLGLSLLFYSSNPLMWALAPILGISSKFLIRDRGKHIFNPANLGVILPILLFNDGWVSPGQWGSGAMLAFFFSISALMVLTRVGRIDTSLTFLVVFFGLEALRSVFYLGWDTTWLLHKMSNGSILLFAFFMITDPRTTPTTALYRILWAAGIGVASFIMTSWFYLHTAPLWALFFSAPLLMITDRLSKAGAFQWQSSKDIQPLKKSTHMKSTSIKAVAMIIVMLIAPAADLMAFCGFYVAKADAKLFNNRSEVILVRQGDKTTVTMSNDFKGSVKDFAMVVPVPEVLQENDIKVVNRSVFDKLNEYSAPRLVEYYDEQPCAPMIEETFDNVRLFSSAESQDIPAMAGNLKRDHQVTIEAEYQIGEYDILILSARESEGLRDWLIENEYRIPESADEVLEPYIKSEMKFFVVKVNLDQYLQSASDYLSPIQVTYQSDRFMLPIRLGMANADGPQDLIVYALTDQGRVECTNYRTVELPTARNVPTLVKPKFGEFYKSLFEKQWKQEGKKAVFLEYAWDVSPQVSVKCDPCIGPPPVVVDLQNTGVDWLTNGGWGGQVYFTRLHVRYQLEQFPQDLQFQVTPNKERFQCRYILTHPATGDMSCDEGQKYLRDLANRRQREIQELEALSGWTIKHSDSYINEFDNQLEHKNELIPVIDDYTGSDKGGGATPFPWAIPVTFSVLMLIASAYGILRKRGSVALA